MFEIRRYTDSDSAAWNDFVKKSRQGTFLFDRNYMDYHKDRFKDYSFMFYKKRSCMLCSQLILMATSFGLTKG